jgi:hypothetical protein
VETHGIHGADIDSVKPSPSDQLINKEERETGDAGVKPYMLCLPEN